MRLPQACATYFASQNTPIAQALLDGLFEKSRDLPQPDSIYPEELKASLAYYKLRPRSPKTDQPSASFDQEAVQPSTQPKQEESTKTLNIAVIK